MYAPRYFCPRIFAPRYWPPSIAIAVVEAAPSGVRRRRYVRLERLPEPAYIDRYINEEVLKQLEDLPEPIKEVVEEAAYQHEQTKEDENIILVMLMLGWI